MSYGNREKIDDESLESIAVEFLRTALGGPDTDIGVIRLRNLEAYNAEPVGEFAPPEILDRSDFVATDVADTVDGMLPQILRMFVAGSDAVECKAKTPRAEAMAKQATAYLNHIFYVRNDGLSVLYDWFHDALLQKVGYVQVWAEEDPEDSKQTYEGQTPESITLLLEDGGEIVGEPEQTEEGLTVTIANNSKRISYKVAAVPPHEMRVDPNARWGDEPAAIGRTYFQRKFELEEEGIDCSDIGAATSYRSDSEALEMTADLSDHESPEFHESHRTYEVADIYMKLDRDGDGVAEWLRIKVIGDKIAIKDGKPDIEQVDGHPYCIICPKPRPHSFYGDCPADRAYQPQRQRTFLMRSLLDAAAMTVNGRMYVNTNAQVNIDDLLDNRPGGIVRGQGDAGSALSPLLTPSMPAPVWQLNEWMESWRESRTSFNRYSAGTDANALNKTKGGVEILTQKADMGMELMARFFAVGVREMFAKLLKLVTKHQNQADSFALSGQWLQVMPTEWRDQFNLEINVGIGQGTKEQLAARLLGMAELQKWGQPSGVVRPEHVAATIRTYAEANDFKDPDKFADEQPSGMPPNPQAFQQMQQEMQQAMQQHEQQLAQLAQENQQLKAQLQDRSMDYELKAAELALKEQEQGIKAQESVHKQEMDVRKAYSEETAPDRVMASAELEGVQSFAEAAQTLTMAAQALMAMAATQAAPRVVQITGPSGQVYTGESVPVMPMADEGMIDG